MYFNIKKYLKKYLKIVNMSQCKICHIVAFSEISSIRF